MNFKENSPWLFYFIVLAGVLFIFSLWFFWHPNSPWHSRNSYFVSFEEIGDLKINNSVNVNGLKKGYVEEFKLADSCVWIKIAVLSEVKIPKDSKFRVVNAGLMGERLVEITLGNSKDYHSRDARIKGYFEMGSTNIGNITIDIIKETSDIVEIVEDVIDTLFSKKKVEEYKKLWQKAKLMGTKTSRVLNSAEHSMAGSIDSLIEAKDKVAEIVDNIKPNLGEIAENIEQLIENFSALEKSLEKMINSATSIAEKLSDDKNTVSLSLNKKQNGSLRREMAKISQDAEILMEKIKKDGLDLNVTIFKKK